MSQDDTQTSGDVEGGSPDATPGVGGRKPTTQTAMHGWGFEVVRVLRALVGVGMIVAMVFDVNNIVQRSMTNPLLGALVAGAISQVIQVEDIRHIMSIGGGGRGGGGGGGDDQ